jgi:predicted transposase/invertase (TIGR01784 family)
MLLSEWKLEEAQQVWREEGMELGREEGIERGIEQGIERGHIEDARAMFAEGDSLDKISRVTRIPVDRLKEILPPQ